MQTKFKRHQSVILTRDPNPEYVEHQPDFEETVITKGMKGKINILLPNGQYHVEILDDKSNTIAYIKADEDEIIADE